MVVVSAYGSGSSFVGSKKTGETLVLEALRGILTQQKVMRIRLTPGMSSNVLTTISYRVRSNSERPRYRKNGYSNSCEVSSSRSRQAKPHRERAKPKYTRDLKT